jgi:hypothetical protein
MLVTLVSGCAYTNQSAGRNVSKADHQHRLLRLAVYCQGEYTGMTAVDLKKASLMTALRPGLSEGHAWGMLKTRISGAEVAELRKLADKAELRSFRPKSSWFKTCPLTDQGSDLVLAWDDKEVVYAIPPNIMRKSLSKRAKKAYTLMDAIVCRLDELQYKYRQDKSHITKVKTFGPEYKQFIKELEQVLDKSLPEKRIGW